MDTGLIITPIAGAVIGYFTNWLAIKMLFRPYKEKKLFGCKLPFTPGLIPKEKDRIAKALGNAVGEQLLTSDTIIESLTKENVLESIDNLMDAGFDKVKLSYLKVDDVAKKIFGEKWQEISNQASDVICKKMSELLASQNCRTAVSEILNSNIRKILDKKLEDLPMEKILQYIKNMLISSFKDISESGIVNSAVEKSVWSFITSLKEDERKISEIVSCSTVDELKDYLSLKAPEAANALISMTDDPEVEEFLKGKIANVISSFTGPLVGMFIKPDDVYVKVIEGITNYFNDPINMPEIEEQIGKAVDKFIENTVGSVATMVSGQIRENTVNKITSFIVSEAGKEENIELFAQRAVDFINDNSQKSIIDIIDFDGTADKKIYDMCVSLTDSIFTKLLEVITPENVEEKICSLLKLRISVPAAHFSLENFISVKKIIKKGYCALVRRAAPKMIEAFSVSGVVEEKVNSFSMEFTEKLILSIAKKELSAITAIGGVLGFVIGLVPVIVSLF
ncbi:MAG: DUF445 domain-containing protein [Clostridia bacterium]|nr:DUF445 domain-containing protein [Clostridia bacterium]